ncbi:putative long-chain-fatty-acid-CoA ligase [Talaromyces proteolyticus]|uniref:Long-chain-fatty-acid-CoA ligase n=1 Tax=Talaromyces proteolyticus TaxID=1131652 RepID=A0AAD4KDQ4_9EURO|nr:putative long-chain-fatty-acid-CoA ligase [Talaromyces proteolyticus]KAH8689374.1 putative long-chain-fatty-acid-CoA ligase [Talaromyces proteolyticus]
MVASTQSDIALTRLQQTERHIDPEATQRENEKLSIVQGQTNPPLWEVTLSELLELQCLQHRDSDCLVVPWTDTRWTYGQLKEESERLARGLIAKGIKHGDCVAVMAGNCEQYVSLFFATAVVGAIFVVINNNYTESELLYALKHTSCKLLFISPNIGRHSLEDTIHNLEIRDRSQVLPSLELVIIRGRYCGIQTYDDIIKEGQGVSKKAAYRYSNTVSPYDVCNLQFTSGSTGDPKASMLTHHNLVNNSRFIGDRMNLTSSDTLCCPPPLFHCFGLVLGLLACLTHGAKVVYPGETFDPAAVLKAISQEKCTAVHGVPTMFESILSLPKPEGFDCSHLRTGIIAGAPVPYTLMQRLVNELNMTEFTSSYGLTEASPTCFNAFTYDSIDRRLTTVGKVMPHASAKIIDPKSGRTVRVGERGELCISGYQVHYGYWRNPKKTSESLIQDEDGKLWLRTGDEASFDLDGYCTITGRFKDIIIRGGENIYPLEIEERLVAHEAVARAAVIGVPDRHYGEVVGAFIEFHDGPAVVKGLPSGEDLRDWTRKTLGRHKAPKYFFVCGSHSLIPRTLPQTGSGKIQKQVLRELSYTLLEQAEIQATLQ